MTLLLLVPALASVLLFTAAGRGARILDDEGPSAPVVEVSAAEGAALGGTVGGTLGGAVGAVLGSVVPVLGNLAGLGVGSAVGSAVGAGLGGLVGGQTTTRAQEFDAWVTWRGTWRGYVVAVRVGLLDMLAQLRSKVGR